MAEVVESGIVAVLWKNPSTTVIKLYSTYGSYFQDRDFGILVPRGDEDGNGRWHPAEATTHDKHKRGDPSPLLELDTNIISATGQI